MLTKDKKYLALDKIIFERGQTVIHKNLGYTAKIVKFYARGNALIEIPDTPENRAIWQGRKLPKSFKAINIAKHFKHPVLTLNLQP